MKTIPSLGANSKDRFVKGLIMALHSENITLSDPERSLYEFILSHKSKLDRHRRGWHINSMFHAYKWKSMGRI